jgi:RimJ/RimL family protein N-acetyltransferase
MDFYEEKGISFCGLACALCSEEACVGCKARGCKEVCDCSVYKCAIAKELDGCYQCDQFPCDEGMLRGTRIRAFNQYARQFGKQALLNRLHSNFENGITYHRPDGLTGDYDSLETEDEIMQLIQFGKSNPYKECPVFETEHFMIRLIREADANDLLECYDDPKARLFFNNDGFQTGDYDYRNCMTETIHGWLDQEYAKGCFIRLAIVNKQTHKAIGTIEIYDRKNQQSERTTGILRIDIAHFYEKESFLTELFTISSHIFFDIFHSETIIHKAIPEAKERISALKKVGYQPIIIEGREHYWACKR